jgi:hypothetical protein
MYESMYKMEKKRQKNIKRQSGSRGGMPWTHLKFLTELVYNLIFFWADCCPPINCW